MRKEDLNLDKNKWEENIRKILKESAKLREKQVKEGTLCIYGATTPKEHLGICDYCWEGRTQK